jgi:threonylcarbamoyladenosine tRNA methylthiotransferase MtaB
MSRPPEVLTFGCRLNAYESEVIRGHAEMAGWTDTVVINSCAVTREAERQTRQAIRRLRRQRPDARIVVTGCAAQIDPEKFAAMAEVDQVIGNSEKMRAASYQARPDRRVMVADIMTVSETTPHLIDGFDGRARAFVEVQQGCDHRCSFCIIPFGRGPNRSVALGPLVDQVCRLAAVGFREVVLTGVDITAYGGDLPGRPTLGQMVRRLLAIVPDLPRLRLSSLDPVEIDDDLLRLVAEEPRLMPHFHLSVQAGDDTILKRMKRRHQRQDVVRLAQTLRRLRPDIALGADLIAGFPTESDSMFANSLALLDEIGLTHLHVFPFSPRPGTPAARMPQVAGPTIRERAALLRQQGDRLLSAFRTRQIGRTASVLVEQNDQGHCQHYLPVRLTTPATAGSIHEVRIIGIDDRHLIGTLAA